MILPKNLEIDFELEECGKCPCFKMFSDSYHEDRFDDSDDVAGKNYIVGCQHIKACRRMKNIYKREET
jgi:hypothetical protein